MKGVIVNMAVEISMRYAVCRIYPTNPTYKINKRVADVNSNFEFHEVAVSV